MNFEEFDNTKFYAGIKIKYRDDVKLVTTVDFEERLIGFIEVDELEDYKMNLVKPSFARCENVIIYKESQMG